MGCELSETYDTHILSSKFSIVNAAMMMSASKGKDTNENAFRLESK